MQRDLVSTLNTELNKKAPGQNIEVRAHNETITEAMGIKQAHVKAREIGKDSKAILVIWGNRVDEKKFHSRLTIVEDQPRTVMAGDRTLEVQSLTELSLPVALVNQPIFLTHFAAGYSFYDRKDYATALTHFEAALKRPVANSNELTDIHSYAGDCHWSLAQGQMEMESHLRHAIAYYDTVLLYYTEKDFPEQWAMTQNNLGIAYGNLPTSDPIANLQKAIAAFEAALRVYTEKDFPVQWAATQNNLGIAYKNLPTGDRNTNLQKAIAALRVYTEKDFPVDWAGTQNNFGNTYTDLPTGDRGANLQKAIVAYEAALRVYTEKDFPMQWAITQNNLGVAYRSLPTGDRGANLQKAIAAYEAALRVHTEKDFPAEWAMTQNNLGVAYWDLPKGDRSGNLQKAITCFGNALKIWTAKTYPNDHQVAAENLKNAQTQLQNLPEK